MHRLRLPPLHLFLIGLYPILTLAAENAEEIVSLSEIGFSVALTLTVTGIAWVGSGFVTRERTRRGVLAFVGVVFFGWFGVYESTLRALGWAGAAAESWIVFAAWVAAAGAAAFLIARRAPPMERAARFLTSVSAILIVFPLFALARAPRSPPAGVEARPAVPRGDTAEAGPDVYLIVLDKYTGATPLADHYGFDNNPFLDSLRARGFAVPTRARANYVHTTQALASMLNWTHLLDVADDVGTDRRDRTPLYRMIQDNRAWQYLEARGYEYVFFPTPYRGTTRSPHADVHIPEPFAPSIEFGQAWLLHTAVAPAVSWLCSAVGCEDRTSGRFPYPPESADQLEWKLDRLAELASRPGPKFVFAHLLLPHEPLVFRADCSQRPPLWEPDVGDVDSVAAKRAYVEQIECLDRMLLETVDSILARSESPPIILLQSDHGHGRIVIDPMRNLTVRLSELTDAQVEERISIFAAYHLPEGGDALVYDSITPVNVFPIVLRHYFGEAAPQLEDATYWLEPNRPFEFTRVR